MPTNPIGKNSKNLTVNVPGGMHKRLSELAAKSGLTLSQYSRAVLEGAIDDELIFELRRREPERSELEGVSKKDLAALRREAKKNFWADAPPAPEEKPENPHREITKLSPPKKN